MNVRSAKSRHLYFKFFVKKAVVLLISKFVLKSVKWLLFHKKHLLCMSMYCRMWISSTLSYSEDNYVYKYNVLSDKLYTWINLLVQVCCGDLFVFHYFFYFSGALTIEAFTRVLFLQLTSSLNFQE